MLLSIIWRQLGQKKGWRRRGQVFPQNGSTSVFCWVGCCWCAPGWSQPVLSARHWRASLLILLCAQFRGVLEGSGVPGRFMHHQKLKERLSQKCPPPSATPVLSEGETPSTEPSFSYSTDSPTPRWERHLVVHEFPLSAWAKEAKARDCPPAPHLQTGRPYTAQPMLVLAEAHESAE